MRYYYNKIRKDDLICLAELGYHSCKNNDQDYKNDYNDNDDYDDFFLFFGLFKNFKNVSWRYFCVKNLKFQQKKNRTAEAILLWFKK